MTPARPGDDVGTYADVSAFTEDEGPAPDEPTPAPAAASADPGAPRASGTRRRPPWLFLLIGVVLGLGVYWSVATLGDSSSHLPANHPATSAPASASATPEPLDQALVDRLLARLATTPTDQAALTELVTEYLRVERYADAATWQARLVALTPTDKDNRLILGVALFSDSQFAPAEEQWLKAAELDPADPAPWYNLGFLYLSLDPPQDDRTEAAWRKVVELAPGTSMAETVGEHLDRLDTSLPSPTPSPTPGR